MSKVCLECGQLIGERQEWRGLRVERTPDAVYFRGIRQPHLTSGQCEMLWLLVLKAGGIVSNFALALLPGEETKNPVRIVNVQIHYLRRWLAAQALPFTIETERGAGYRLQAMPEAEA